MNALALNHDLKERGVLLEADSDRFLVDAPAGELTDEDKATLTEFKPILLKFLSGREETRDDGRRFDARPSRYPGYTSLYDTVYDEWHDFPTRNCYPSIVALANKKRKRGGATWRGNAANPPSASSPLTHGIMVAATARLCGVSRSGRRGGMSEEPRYEDVVHALRMRLAGNPRVRDLPAEDLSDDLLYNGDLSTKPDPALVRKALREIGRDQGGRA